MKVCLAAYIAAIKKINEDKSFSTTRAIHLLFLPDEEVGGRDGMGLFVKTELFRSLNVGFALDEGLASGFTSTVPIYFGEKAIWWIKVKSYGKTGHASKFLEADGAVEKLHRCCDRALQFRQKQADKFHAGASIGDVVTMNLTALQAGHSSDGGVTYALNVIPSECEAGFDIRIPPNVDLAKFETELKQILLSDEEGIEYEKVNGMLINPMTSLDPVKNLWWSRFQKTCSELSLEIQPEIFPAATDSRFLREIDIPCIGFTPIPNVEVKFHDHDEYLPVDAYLKAIEIYVVIIRDLVSILL